jgi:hypothetical protein
MQGNLHVPFLGGWAGAIPPGYPAGESNLASLSRRICHIPTDFVVTQEASDVESSSRLDLLLLHNLRRRFIA